MRCCASCCRILDTDLMHYDWGEWRCNNSNLQNNAECEWISSFDNTINDSIPDFSNEQIANDFLHGIIPAYIIQRWIVRAFKWEYPSLDGFTIGKLEKVMPIDKDEFIWELKTMVSLGEIDKKGFRYSIGKTYAEINERVSKLEQKYKGIIEEVKA
jgi:hypothetical protein